MNVLEMTVSATSLVMFWCWLTPLARGYLFATIALAAIYFAWLLWLLADAEVAAVILISQMMIAVPLVYWIFRFDRATDKN